MNVKSDSNSRVDLIQVLRKYLFEQINRVFRCINNIGAISVLPMICLRRITGKLEETMQIQRQVKVNASSRFGLLK